MELSLIGNYGTVDGGRFYGPDSTPRELEGFSGVNWGAYDSRRKRRVMEAARLYADVMTGETDPVFIREAMKPKTPALVMHLMERYPSLYRDSNNRTLGLRETMSVTDYQALFVDVLDRMYYGFYNGFPVVNKSLVKVHQLRDFRVVSRFMNDGVVSPLTAMDAAAPPPQRALLGPTPQDGSPATTTAPVQYQPKLYQAMTSVNWRAFVNDDLGIFKDLSQRLAIAGNRGISKFITTQYVSASGPNTSLYQGPYNNQIIQANGASINNPPLGSQGIMDAIKILAGMRDSGGDPILITGRLKLWYGPDLAAVAENLMNATRVGVSVEGGSFNTQGFPTQWLETNNWLVRNMDLVMDPYIPIVCTAAGIQRSMWGITVDPESVARPAIEVGFLKGFEIPVIYSKMPNTQVMGGGVDPMMGDFYSMDQDMKVVTVMGASPIDGRTTVASTGASQ